MCDLVPSFCSTRRTTPTFLEIPPPITKPSSTPTARRSCGIGLLGRPASESGRLCHVAPHPTAPSPPRERPTPLCVGDAPRHRPGPPRRAGHPRPLRPLPPPPPPSPPPPPGPPPPCRPPPPAGPARAAARRLAPPHRPPPHSRSPRLSPSLDAAPAPRLRLPGSAAAPLPSRLDTRRAWRRRM